MSEHTFSDALVIPKTGNDITRHWLIQATGKHPVENTIAINDNIQDGVGFLSNLCRVTFQTESGTKESVLVKLLPDNPEFLALTINQAFDKREVQFYSVALPLIAGQAPELQRNLCKFYCGKHIGEKDSEGEDYASMLVFGDLKPLGYEMLNPESEKWEENLKKVIKFLAEFHAAGFALKEEKPEEFSRILSFCMGADEDGGAEMLVAMGVANSSKLGELLAKHNVPLGMLQSYEKLSENVEDLLLKVLSKGAEFPCLIHGDIWPPNVMVNEAMADSPLKVIDWQLLGHRDATYELTIGIMSCLPRAKMNRANITVFAKMYWDEFNKACKANGCSHKGRDEEEFMQFFNTWGMAFGYYWFLLSIDSFPNDQEKLCQAFEAIHEEYKMADFLQNCS